VLLLEGSCVVGLSMIGVEPFVPLLEGSCVCVLVALRVFQVEIGLCGFAHAKCLCSLNAWFWSLGWVCWPLLLKPVLCAHLVSTHS
jgi:hypothetical protein